MLRAATAATKAANEAKSSFLANVSHEIRTPLNAVIWLAHLLQRTPLSTEQAPYVQNILLSGKSLLGSVNDVLDLSVQDRGWRDGGWSAPLSACATSDRRGRRSSKSKPALGPVPGLPTSTKIIRGMLAAVDVEYFTPKAPLARKQTGNVKCSHTLVASTYELERDMSHDAIAALGSDFSNWAQLTEEYAKGLEALRRRELGASARMMEIAQLMGQYSAVVGQQGIPSIPVQHAAVRLPVQSSMNLFERAVHMLSSFELRTGRNDASLSY